MYHNKKGEIATFISIATLIAISVFTFVTANINTNTASKQTTSTQAAYNCGSQIGTAYRNCDDPSYTFDGSQCCATNTNTLWVDYDSDWEGYPCPDGYNNEWDGRCTKEITDCNYNYNVTCSGGSFDWDRSECCDYTADPYNSEFQSPNNTYYPVVDPYNSEFQSPNNNINNTCNSGYCIEGSCYNNEMDYVDGESCGIDGYFCCKEKSLGNPEADSYIGVYNYCEVGFCQNDCGTDYEPTGQTNCSDYFVTNGVCCKNITYNSNENCNSTGGQCILGSCDGAEMDVVSGGICETSEYSCCKNKTIYDNLIKNFNQLFPSDGNTVKTPNNTYYPVVDPYNSEFQSPNNNINNTCNSGYCIEGSCYSNEMDEVPSESCGVEGYSCCKNKVSGNKPWTYTTCECNDDGYWNDNCTDKKGKPCEDPTKESSTNTCQDLSGICVNESAIMDSKYETVSGGGGCPSAYVCVKLKIASKPSGQEGTTPYIPPGNVPEKPVPAGANPAASNPAAGKGDGSSAPGENKGSGASDQGNKLTPTTNPIVSNSNIGGCVSPNQCMASSALGCRIGGDVLPVPCSSGQAYTGNQYNAATGNFCQIGNTIVQAPCTSGQTVSGVYGLACNFGGMVVQANCQTGQNVAANQTATGTTCFIGGTPIPYSCTIGQPTIGVNGVYGSACNFNGMVVQASCATSMGIPGNQNYSGSACQIGGKVVQVPCSAGIPAQLQANITSCQNGGSAVSLTCPTAGQICCAQPNILQGLTGTLSTALGTLMNRLINPVPSSSYLSTSTSSTSSNGSITPTLTPTPTSTPTQGGLDNPNGVDVTFDMKLKFHGITTTPKSELNRMRVQVTIVDTSVMSGTRTAVQTGEFTASGSAAIWTGSVKFTKVEPKKTYQLLVKGSKHVQKKICTNSPTETAAGSYSCKELLDVVAGSNNLDLSNIYMMAGDVPKQDGMVNSIDFGAVRTKFGSLDYTSLETADLNLDGAINSVDFSLILQTLQTTDGIDQK